MKRDKIKNMMTYCIILILTSTLIATMVSTSIVQAGTPVLDPTDIIVIGMKNDAASDDPVLFRMDKDGNLLWEKHLPFVHLWTYEFHRDRNLAEDSIYIMPGYTHPENKIDGKNRILKYDGNGNLLWDIPFSPDTESVSANPVNGGAYITDSKLGVYRIDSEGNILWGPKDFGYSASNWLLSTDVTSGGVYAINYHNNVVLKIDSDGNLQWTVSITGPGRVNANPIDGGVYVGAGDYARDTYRLDDKGNTKWVKYSFPSPYDSYRGVSPFNGAIYVAGSFPHLFAKAEMDGTVSWTVPRDIPFATSSVVGDIEGNNVYTGDGYNYLGISKFSGTDGSLIWHKDPGYYVYNGNYGPGYGIITGNPSRAPMAKPGGTYTGNEGESIAFDASASSHGDPDSAIVSYEWDFGDGTTSTGVNPSHTYADNGEYTATLTVTDDNVPARTDSKTVKVTVNNVAPTVDLGSDQTVNEGDIFSLAPATFSDLGTSDTHSATINWGDGTALEAGTLTESGGSGTVSGSHSFAKYGSYNVEVCVTDDDGASSCDTFELTVRDITPPVITINGDNPLIAVLGTPYVDPGAMASDNSDGAITVTTTGIVNTASAGTYPVTYTATDFSGNTATATRPVNVIYAPAGSNCLDAPGHELLQPINREKNSVFKKGSTVPAKFRVCDANGNSIGTTGVVSIFKLIQSKSGTVVNAVNEDVISTTHDTTFRWDQTAQQWIFNINTKNLEASYTYTYRISLDDGTYIDFTLGLK